MFNAVVQSLQSIRTLAYNVFWPSARPATGESLDEYVLIDAPHRDRPAASRPMPPAPAPTPAQTPTAQPPLTVAKLMESSAYAKGIDTISQRVALAQYAGISHVIENKPAVWTPSVLGFGGSDARFRACFNEAQAKSRKGLDGAAVLANTLVETTANEQQHLERAAIARQVEADLQNKWCESLHGHIMDCYINAKTEANAKELPHLRWNGKLVRVQNTFHGELTATADQLLNKLSILEP